MFYDLISEHPHYGLEDAMAIIWDNFVSDFRSYWGLDARETPEHLDYDAWRDRVEIARLVERLAGGASHLSRPRKTTEVEMKLHEWLQTEAKHAETMWSEVLPKLKQIVREEDHWKLDLLESDDPADPQNRWAFMHNCMQLAAFHLYPDGPSGKADRLFALLSFLIERPSQRCREYLPRVAECYVRGLRIEMAVMTRAVLDAALRDAFADQDVKDKVGVAGKDVSLERRMQHAIAVEAFDRSAARAADNIREIGNKAAHADLSVEVSADDLLRDLRVCLDSLDRWEKEP